ncbi:hypothetical protein [Roseicyclus mahoneyensis]|nr:hypothetical protein [Roseicyclus mahoneyensis]
MLGKLQKRHRVHGSLVRIETTNGTARRVWCDPKGRVVMEEYIVGQWVTAGLEP